jgi:hypothetical protein
VQSVSTSIIAPRLRLDLRPNRRRSVIFVAIFVPIIVDNDQDKDRDNDQQFTMAAR